MQNVNDTGADSEESDYDALTSEWRIPKLLIRGKSKDEKSYEHELKWEILSNTEDSDEMNDLKTCKRQQRQSESTRIRNPDISQSK